jgi:hypothetical protein
MNDLRVILRFTRYEYVRYSIYVVAFLTFAIWILEVFDYERPPAVSARPVHSHHRRPDVEQPVTRKSAEEDGKVNQLHKLSTIQHDTETGPVNLGETFIWNPE